MIFSNCSRAGDWLVFRPLLAEKCACPLAAPALSAGFLLLETTTMTRLRFPRIFSAISSLHTSSLKRRGRIALNGRPRFRQLRLETCEKRELLASITGTVFEDLTGNGISADDPTWSIPQITLELYKDTNTNGVLDDPLFATTQTDPTTGKYSFDALNDGGYFIRQLPPPGAAQTAGPDVYSFDVINDTVLSSSGLFIDDFINDPTPVQSYFINAYDPDPTLLQAAGPGIFGGWRDMLVDVTDQANPLSASGEIGDGSYEFASAIPGTTVTLTYDGNYTEPPTDLTAGGKNTGFRIDFVSLQVGGTVDQMDLMVCAASSSGNGAYFFGTTSESTEAYSIFIPFESFAPIGDFSFTAVNSVEVVFNCNSIQDVDFEVTAIVVDSQPDFANVWLSSLPSKRAFIWPYGSWMNYDRNGQYGGTNGDDLFEFNATTGSIKLNGEVIPYDLQDGPVHFDGLGGNDTVVLIGTAGQETVVLGDDYAQLVGDDWSVSVVNVEQVTVNALGGHDTADVYDSPGDDAAWTRLGGIGITGTGFQHTAVNIETIHVHAAAGHDTAKMYDSSGDDLYVAATGYAQLSGNGFLSVLTGFDAVHAFATAGGNDTAKFYDSVGDDTFYATPVEAALYNAEQYYRAKYFDAVHAFATAGGHDRAVLFDSAGDDTFYATPVEAAMYNGSFYNRAKFFEDVQANANAGGYDCAYLFDSAGDDHLEAADGWAQLSYGTKMALVSNFDWVKAISSSGGNDTKHVEAVDFTLLADGPWVDI